MRLMHGVDFVSLAKPRAMFATVTYDKFARDQSKHTSWGFSWWRHEMRHVLPG